MELRDATALVTGASRGLGYEIASLLARRGANLVIAARDPRALTAAATELRKHTAVVDVAVDVGEGAETLIDSGLKTFGAIDILINNASELGPSPMPALESLPWHALARILRVNAIAPLHLVQLVLPAMKERQRGVIVNVSSDAGVNAYPGWGGYGASKAALEHIGRTLGEELKASGIRVLTVDPGDMNTQMHRAAEPGVDLSHLPDPSRVAPAFIEMLADDALPSGRYQAQEMLAMHR